MGSTRLPGKVLKPLAGEPMLYRIVERARRSDYIDQIVIATTGSPTDDDIVSLAKRMNVGYFRGSEDDVLGRLAGAVREFNPHIVVCLTGDNPLIDPGLIDDMIEYFSAGKYDYISSTHMQHSELWQAERTFPAGVSVQVVKATALLETDREATDLKTRGHGTLGIYHRADGKYKRGAFQSEGSYCQWRHPGMRLTVDTREDYELLGSIFEILYPSNPNFSTIDAIKLVLQRPELTSINAQIKQRIAGRK